MATSERRNKKRRKIQSGIIGLIMDEKTCIGKIVDVSVDGLAFICSEADPPPSRSIMVDILIMDRDLFWSNVPCTVVAIDEYQERGGRGMGEIRRWGVKIDYLNEYERHRLTSFVTREERAEHPGVEMS